MAKKQKLTRAKKAHVTDLRNESRVEREQGITSASVDKNGKERQEEPIQNDGLMFPIYFPWIVALATSCFRVLYVTNPKNWWVLHPDEIFQSMEVAHSEVYGYGLRPYEFMSPATGDNLSHYQLVEQQLGMHAMRSPLMAQFYVLVATLCGAMGLKLNPYVMWRVSHVVVTSCLPVAISKFTVVVTKSSDVGSIAAVLCALSSDLNVFGTHTIVNSFVSPFLFWALASAVHALEGSCSSISNGNENTQKPLMANPNRNGLTACGFTSNGHANGNTKYNSYGISNSNTNDQSTDISNSKDHSCGKSNVHSSEYVNGHSPASQLERAIPECCKNSALEEETNSANNNYRQLGNDNNNHHNHQQNCEPHQLSMTDNSFYRDSKVQSTNSGLRTLSTVTNVTSGLVLIVSTYVRPDSVLLVTFICAPYLFNKSFFKLVTDFSCLCFVFGGVIGLLIAIYNDVWFYGCLTLSPVNWVNFNVISGRSGHLFGESDFLFYFRDNFIYIISICYVFTLTLRFVLLPSILLLIDNVFKQQMKHFSNISFLLKLCKTNLANLHHVHRFIVSSGVLLAIYSHAGHKEKRFVHDAFVLCLASGACAVQAAVSSGPVSRLCSRRKALALILVAFAAIEWARFRCASRSTNEEWPYKDGERDFTTNECLHFVSQQRDVTGLFMEKNILEAGSFSVLHKKVPMLFLFGKVHIEFTESDLISQNRFCFQNEICNVGFYSLNRVSDLIHEKNSEYLKKRLIESRYYNYAIVSSGKSFFYPAFHKVFARRDISVWRRTFDAEAEDAMTRSSSQIPAGGLDAAVMELEGEILKQMGSYSTALSRFGSAMAFMKSKVEIYASMAFCYFKMGDEARMNQILRTCFVAFNREDCLQGARVRVSNLLISGLDLTLK